ncbi:DUF2325 domain-containing protein, partial [Paenibacillus cisolokensis]|uniref:DUF2325 domain-containing protein n=1 Tax=Paenibacillus cisolokensis TaxID=1658519 RepID=UPI003D2BFB40
QQARRDALIHVKDKAAFWRAANDYFVREELLYIGAMGWVADLLAKRYGLRRTQFAILHFPIAEAHEPLRAQAMGKLFRRDKGDNAFLLRHIARLTEQLDAAKKRTSEIYRANERLKAEVAESQRKLADAYATIRRLEESRIEATKEPEDKRRLREQKAFIADLLAEVRRLRAMLPEEETPEQEPEDIVAEEAQPDVESDLSHLAGMTVALIGGYRAGHAELDGYPCRVLRHDGRKFDPDYYATLAAADFIIVLTRFISHAAMWDARAYAVESGKPIIYSEAINVARILEQIPPINQKKGEEQEA